MNERTEEARKRINGKHLDYAHGWAIHDAEWLLSEVDRLSAELDRERWQHAACLTIAEGAPDMPPENLQSEAMRAVKRLRLKYDEIEVVMRGFESMKTNLVERVQILRQAYNRAWDKLHPAKVKDTDERHFVTVSLETKQRLMDEFGLTEADFTGGDE